jgi:hypothetical protein
MSNGGICTSGAVAQQMEVSRKTDELPSSLTSGNRLTDCY